jgi:signal transduction histidine kinase
MKEIENRYYFSAVKLCCIIILIIYFLISSEKSLHAISVEWFLLTIAMIAALGFEVVNNEYNDAHNLHSNLPENIKKCFGTRGINKKIIFLCVEIIVTIILIAFFSESNNGLFLLPIVILDMIMFFSFSFVYSLFSFMGILINPVNLFNYIFYCLFIIIIYFQNFIIIEKYKKYLSDYEVEEYQLKGSIESQDMIYKEQLQKSSLAFENELLEEKGRLSQSLHDKLGHSINGSIYQLEACKVLMEKEPSQSKSIIQGVIDNLRTSMDEIRVILRREKPDKKRMAYLQLIRLCSECREKYGIQAEFNIDGEDNEIPEHIWEVILDNAIEAVTNALKYSKCTEITIEILLLHKVVRCSIKDNGIGCPTLIEGMGIQGMKNRARKVNGYIDISSDKGFRINLIIPY